MSNKNAQPKDCRMEQLLQNRSEFKSLSTVRQPAVAEALSLGKTQTLQEKRPLGRAQVFHTHRQAQAREVRGGNPDPEMASGATGAHAEESTSGWMQPEGSSSSTKADGARTADCTSRWMTRSKSITSTAIITIGSLST